MRAKKARDAGLQPERTALSWQRTALSTAMVALLLAFACLRGGFLVGTAIAGVVAVAAGATLFVVRHRTARNERVSPWTPLTRIAVLLVVTAVLGAVLALLILL
jgi:uncharacterized membrane protein YidH (DUF202 family)